MKNIDQLLIKIPGKAYIGQKLTLGQDVTVLVKGAVVKEETADNQDGSVNITYVVKATLVELLSKTQQDSKSKTDSSSPVEDNFLQDIEEIELPEEQEDIDPKDIPF